MASVEENREAWTNWDWNQQGDEWSTPWGGTAALWYGALLPRLHHWLPTGTLLEIGPGSGRWTQYLKELARSVVLVDLTEVCIKACRERFRESSNLAYHVNDGRSLPTIADGSIDFAFSFDSLVHVEADVIRAYLSELGRTLTPDGIGFIHHSNIGEYATQLAVGRRLPARLRPAVERLGLSLFNEHWRAETMTARVFEELCRQAGLQCRSQEIISWRTGGALIDCFSVFTRSTSRWATPNRVVENRGFMREARSIEQCARLYGPSSTEFPAPASGR